MSSPVTKKQSEEAAEKVLRRAEIAKMGRRLKSQLALASFKARNGWEHLPLHAVEPLAEKELKRKRPHSSGDVISDSSSTISDHHHPAGMKVHPSSPAYLFSDNTRRSGGSHSFKKRALEAPTAQQATAVRGSHKRAQSNSGPVPKGHASLTAWKDSHKLPQSSPAHHRHYSQLSVSRGANLSFASETSTIPLSPNFAEVSDDEDDELPMHSFQASSSHTRSSPPRTPPPSRSRAGRLRASNKNQSNSSHDPPTGKEGADLLLYLAGSPPSSANPGMKTRIFAPATPPSRPLALPSSMMTTPGGLMGVFGNPSTPSQMFDFSDFVNITPSPGQQQWGSRTPHILKTPLAAKEARRKLNFDLMAPPSGSPNLTINGEAGKKRTGLGVQMQLGGELVP